MVLDIISRLVSLYLVILFIRIIFTWFPIEPHTAAARVERFFARLTDPLLSRLRRVLPPARVGAMSLDLSPIVVFVVGIIVLRLL